VGRTIITASISLVFVSAALAAERRDGADGRPAVFVHIENRAAVLPETISAARDQLAHVFDNAGLRIESAAVADHDERCALPLTIHVVLLKGAAADRFIKTEGVNRRVLAQANSEARRVYVLWDRIGPSVDHQAVARGDALGLIIAHELGHVLLPALGHSRSGIMRANYDVYLSYRLKFSAQESAAMRAFVASTATPASGVQAPAPTTR
jgi:hypothetical protein